MSNLRKNLKPKNWVSIKYKGKTYLVAVTSLLDAYIEQQLRKAHAHS